MTASQGLLRNRVILAMVLLTCVYGAGASWLSFREHVGPRKDLLLIFGLVCAVFITAAVALRSSFCGDQIVFGAFAAALVMTGIKTTVPLAANAIFAVKIAESLLWTIAALASLVVLARGFMASRRT